MAGASQDLTPRVGIVLSSFIGSSDHDGRKIDGLAEPRPVDAALTAAQLDGLVRKAIELGDSRRGRLEQVIAPEDWVVIKPNISCCYGQETYVRGTVTDLRVVRSVIAYLLEKKAGRRFTIAEGSGQWRAGSPTDGWTTAWGGDFGGLTYYRMVEEFAHSYPHLTFEIVDLNFDTNIAIPVPWKASARNNPEGVYVVPKTIQRCDKLISIAPLKTHRLTGVSLSMKNYFGIGPGSVYGFPKCGLHTLGRPDEVISDLFSFHPADYAIVGGSWGVEGDGPDGPGAATVHHNVIIAGTKALSVDAVAAAIMGFNPNDIVSFRIAERRGFGIRDLDSMWLRGNDIGDARRVFRRPAS